MAEKKDREYQLGLVAQQKGGGKTYLTLESQVMETLNGNYGQKRPEKVLFMDSNNEYGDVRNDHKRPDFPNIRAIRFEHVAQWCQLPVIEARRVSIMKPVELDGSGGGRMSHEEFRVALLTVLGTFRNGLFVLEDLSNYVGNSLPDHFVGNIVTTRHIAVDTIIHFQTITKMAHPQLFANANWLRIGKCEDSIAHSKENLKTHLKALSIAEKLIDINYYGRGVPPNPQFYVYLNKDTGKLSGKLFNKRMFMMAVESYLADNITMVAKEINRVELRSGQRVHQNRGAAIDFMVKECMDQYYGNPDYSSIPAKKIIMQ